MTEQLNWLNWSLLIFCWGFFYLCSFKKLTFFGSFIVWFWHQGNEGFIEWVWQYFLTFNFTENLRRMGPNYSLNVWRITLWRYGVLYIRNQQNMAHKSVHSAIYFVNKFCWNTRKLIYLCIIHNLFHETMAEFSSCNRMNGLQRQKCLLFYPLLKKFVIPSSTSLVIMEMQVNATVRSLYTH